MRTELLNIETIETFLSKNMSKEELLNFENNMFKNEALRNSVELQKNIQKRIALNAFKENLESFENTSGSPKNYKKGINFFALGVMLILLISGLFLWLKSEKHSKIKIKMNLENLQDYQNKKDELFKVLNENEKHSKDLKGEKNKPSKNNSKYKIPSKFKVPYETVTIDNQKGDTIIMKESKSKIYIEPNAILLKNGDIAQGKIDIKYKEYRNVADILFSEIPMTYLELGEKYQFNSAGMFEIRAFQADNELKIDDKKPVLIDYNLVDSLKGLNYYKLDDISQEWTYLNNINLPLHLNDDIPETFDTCLTVTQIPTFKGGIVEYDKQIKKHPLYIAAKEHGLIGVSNFILEINNKGIIEKVIFDDKSKITEIDKIANILFKDLKNFNPGKLGNNKATFSIKMNLEFKIDNHKDYLKTISDHTMKQEQRISAKKTKSFNEEMNALKNEIYNYIIKDSVAYKMEFGDLLKYETIINKISYSKLSHRSFSIGDSLCLNSVKKETYTHLRNKFFVSELMVKLRVNTFGIFNCDQVNVFREPVTIFTNYVDENNHKLNVKYSTLVVKKLRAAFILNGNKFTCSKTANNTIFLLTEKDKIYKVNSYEIKRNKIFNLGEFTFKASEIKADLTNPKNLKRYIRN